LTRKTYEKPPNRTQVARTVTCRRGDFTNAATPICRAFAELFQKFDTAAAHRNLPPFHLPHVGHHVALQGSSSKIINSNKKIIKMKRKKKILSSSFFVLFSSLLFVQRSIKKKKAREMFKKYNYQPRA
jgi:hypothetical protein